MNSDLKEYLDLLGYGNESFVSLSAPSAMGPGESATWTVGADLLLVVEPQDLPSHPGAYELLLKMLGAIERHPQNTELLVLTADVLKKAPANILTAGRRILVMGPGALPWLKPGSESSQFVEIEVPGGPAWALLTHSASECLLNPALKKVVWEDLKKLKSRLDTPEIPFS
jgi:hypothetical protein